jgi:hypothetical protein
MAVKRIIVPAVLVVALLLGGAGCVQNRQQDKQRNINDDALVYMEQKYGEKFEYVSPWGSSYTGTHQLLVKCNSLQDQEILVQVENFKQENKIFRDNYLAVKYREDTIAFCRDYANQVFGETTVFYEVADDGLSADLLATATFHDFLADTRVPLVIMIAVKASNFSTREQAQEVAELIAESGADFYLTIAVLEEAAYGIYDHKTLNKQIALKQVIDSAIIIKRGDDIETVWTEKE